MARQLNNEGLPPLFLAVKYNNNTMIDFFINTLNIDLSCKNKDGESIKEFIERNIQLSREKNYLLSNLEFNQDIRKTYEQNEHLSVMNIFLIRN